MIRSLFGLEAELAVSATQGSRALPTDRLVERLRDVACRTLVHLPGGGSRLFLANGGLFYVDCGMHPEVATPECTTPEEALSHLRAGERLVLRLARAAAAEVGADSLLVSRANVDYAGGTTWGCHESYLGRRPIDHYRCWLIPHLVSRIVYTGSGGLDPLSPGIRPSLSPRVAHIEHAVSHDSTSSRGIFHTRNEPLANGYSRIHVLAGDNACSHRSTWLKVGTTALVVALAESAPPAAPPFDLVDAVGAMKGYARDLDHRAGVNTSRGQMLMTAAELQRGILARAEALVGTPHLPDWAAPVCEAWRAALDLAESNGVRGSRAFDWPLKFALFDREIERSGRSRSGVEARSDAIEQAYDKICRAGLALDPWQLSRASIERLCRDDMLPAGALTTAERALAKAGLSWRELDELNDLRRKLCAIDLRFGALDSGVFDSLDREGLIPEHRVVSEAQIETAAADAPAATRAAARGRWVGRFAGRAGYRCDWNCVIGPEARLDLNDPFSSQGSCSWTGRVVSSNEEEA
jgi:proteasome accessory factor A